MGRVVHTGPRKDHSELFLRPLVEKGKVPIPAIQYQLRLVWPCIPPSQRMLYCMGPKNCWHGGDSGTGAVV